MDTQWAPGVPPRGVVREWQGRRMVGLFKERRAGIQVKELPMRVSNTKKIRLLAARGIYLLTVAPLLVILATAKSLSVPD